MEYLRDARTYAEVYRTFLITHVQERAKGAKPEKDWVAFNIERTRGSNRWICNHEIGKRAANVEISRNPYHSFPKKKLSHHVNALLTDRSGKTRVSLVGHGRPTVHELSRALTIGKTSPETRLSTMLKTTRYSRDCVSAFPWFTGLYNLSDLQFADHRTKSL